MRTVWEFALITGPHLDVELPADSVPVSVMSRRPPYGDDNIQIWVELDRSQMEMKEKLVKFDFFAVQTGQMMPQGYTNLKFLGTVERSNGYIEHVYWRKEER